MVVESQELHSLNFFHNGKFQNQLFEFVTVSDAKFGLSGWFPQYHTAYLLLRRHHGRMLCECYGEFSCAFLQHTYFFHLYLTVHRWAFVFQQATLYISFHIFDAPNYPFKKIKRNEGKIIKQGKKDHGSERAWRLTKAYLRSITTFHTLGTQHFSSVFLFVCLFFLFFSTFEFLSASNYKVYRKPIEEQARFIIHIPV